MGQLHRVAGARTASAEPMAQRIDGQAQGAESQTGAINFSALTLVYLAKRATLAILSRGAVMA